MHTSAACVLDFLTCDAAEDAKNSRERDLRFGLCFVDTASLFVDCHFAVCPKTGDLGRGFIGVAL